MSPERFLPALRLIVIGFVILAVLGLGAWYFYISGMGESIEEASAGRGFGGAVPSFEGSGGSTFGNLLGELPPTAPSESVKERPRLSQIHAAPVSGFRLSSTSVQFMDRSGYLFTADLATERTLRTTNTLIPRVYRAVLGDEALLGITFDEGGESSAFVGTLAVATSTRTLPSITVRDLGDGILAAEAIGDTLLTLVEEPEGGAVLIESAFDGSDPKPRVRSGISGWNIVVGGSRAALVERSATRIPGSAYEIIGTTRVPLVDDIPGLSLSLGPRGAFLYGSDTGSLSLVVRSDRDRVVPLKTIADKCAWLPVDTENPLAFCAVPDTLETETFLDSWYRGETNTRDSWWRVDASDGSVKEIYRSDEDGIGIDAHNPQIDPSGHYIVFRNKYDETLWSLRINE